MLAPGAANMSRRGFVIGNGLSREDFDLHSLRGFTIGCNRIWRDFVPDVVVAIDIEPAREISEKTDRCFKILGRNRQTGMIELDGVPIKLMAEILMGQCNNSGVIAMWYALDQIKCAEVYAIGFDFFRPIPKVIEDENLLRKFHFADGSPKNDIYSKYTVGHESLIAKAFERLAVQYPYSTINRVGPIWPWDRDFFETSFEHVKLLDEMPEFNANS